MPSRWHPAGFASSSTPGSANSSRPSSRASSPTRNGSIARPSHITLPGRRRDGTLDSNDTPSDFASGSFGSHTGWDTPNSAAGTPWGGLMTPSSSSGLITPGGTSHAPHIEIILDSEHLVMRGAGGDMNPAYLSGRVELDLPTSINLKELTMHMTGKAKVQFSDGSGTTSKNHHFTHVITTHDWSFLQGGKGHAHTLKAGHHTFPFSFMLNGNLPSSLRTYSGDAMIVYKLRATGVRTGFASNISTQKEFTLGRMYTSDALEFTQTLEIENTWPGKVMYSLTLPYKAYAAGDDIPVNVKFMPLAKGTRVTQVVSVLKEYTLVHTRQSSRPETRVISCIKHEMKNGRAIEIAREPVRPPLHWNEPHSANRSATTSRHSSPAQTPVVGGRARLAPTWGERPEDSYFPAPSSAGAGSAPGSASTTPAVDGENAQAGPSNASVHSETSTWETDIEVGDDEINTHFTIPIPRWVTPSHAIHPVFVTHKIKWSCSISNPDGHVSELRCALPILILDHSLLEEARSAGASTRGLLFGQTTEEPQIDLPSYSNHVYDRIAIADSGTTASGFMPRSLAATPLASPHDDTPPRSRPPSRPASPTRYQSYGGQSSTSTRSVGEPTPATDVPPRRQLSQWADSELLMSLGALRTHSNNTSPGDTPPDSRTPSRPLSRRNSFTRSGRSSRTGSRANSRASSPERSVQSSSYNSDSHLEENGNSRPGQERRHTGGLHSLFHLPKPMRPLSHLTPGHGHGSKPILRNTNSLSSSNLAPPQSNDTLPRNASFSGGISNGNSNAQVPAQSHGQAQNGTGERSHVSFAPHANVVRNGPRFSIGGGNDEQDDENGEGEDEEEEEEDDPLSRVPSYAIASRGFLGGGVVPLDVALPTYDASEDMQRTRSGTDLSGNNNGLIRPRSDTALMRLGAQAAADAEERAQE
ncbi:uncharacterized protein I206_100332 [Kwoniella pini CBS 10737]|uniref:Arrestin C-terminal-like domain-containing protein n=1 Tax=Kwoniella pini CBS 10737 TaxID=1296096 RepID=A0A1B9IDW0_9TREE|nr:uncharacterized protein I206_00993 [Kwoniella pini CBS 10737]OCF53687.1 hypothetical protein I206_00993 [Kwoniella pini CBS 10737]